MASELTDDITEENSDAKGSKSNNSSKDNSLENISDDNSLLEWAAPIINF